jgi:hypothetical protein
LKPARGNLGDSYLEKTHHKKGWWSSSKVGPEFKSQYLKKVEQKELTEWLKCYSTCPVPRPGVQPWYQQKIKK